MNIKEKLRLPTKVLHKIGISILITTLVFSFTILGHPFAHTVNAAAVGGLVQSVEIVQIAGGNSHFLALDSQGTVWAWGMNDYGQLGDPSYTKSSLPIPVPGLSGIQKIAAGYNKSAAIDGAGNAWAWGENTKGQLGIGNNRFDVMTPTAVMTTEMTAAVREISFGVAHTLFLDINGFVWAAGNNSYGEFGSGWGNYQSSHKPVKNPTLQSITSTSAGYANNLAMDSTGKIFAWGNCPLGIPVMGDGNASQLPLPTRLTQPEASSLPQQMPNMFSVVCAALSTFAVSQDNHLFIWGHNSTPQLIAGVSQADMWSPYNTQTGNVAALAQNSRYSKSNDSQSVVYITLDGFAYAWGQNTGGMLGVGSTSATIAAPGSRVTTIAANSILGTAGMDMPLLSAAAIAGSAVAGDSNVAYLDRFGNVWSGGGAAILNGDGTKIARSTPGLVLFGDMLSTLTLSTNVSSTQKIYLPGGGAELIANIAFAQKASDTVTVSAQFKLVDNEFSANVIANKADFDSISPTALLPYPPSGSMLQTQLLLGSAHFVLPTGLQIRNNCRAVVLATITITPQGGTPQVTTLVQELRYKMFYQTVRAQHKGVELANSSQILYQNIPVSATPYGFYENTNNHPVGVPPLGYDSVTFTHSTSFSNSSLWEYDSPLTPYPDPETLVLNSPASRQTHCNHPTASPP